IEFIGVTPHMLKTLGLTIRRGRELSETESFAKSPYAVVNDAMAKKFWPSEDPLGRRFRPTNDSAAWFTVVGVVPDYRHGELDDTDPVAPCAYVSFAWSAFANTGLTVRAAGHPERAVQRQRQGSGQLCRRLHLPHRRRVGRQLYSGAPRHRGRSAGRAAGGVGGPLDPGPRRI